MKVAEIRDLGVDELEQRGEPRVGGALHEQEHLELGLDQEGQRDQRIEAPRVRAERTQQLHEENVRARRAVFVVRGNHPVSSLRMTPDHPCAP